MTRFFVMAGLVPAIHVFPGLSAAKTWMPGTRPGMTKLRYKGPILFAEFSVKLCGGSLADPVPPRPGALHQPVIAFHDLNRRAPAGRRRAHPHLACQFAVFRRQ